MTLRIGSRKGFTPLHPESPPLRRGVTGFTLVEVMAATAVLSLGILLIYEAFFNLIDSFDYYLNYLQVAPFANEKVWQAQESIRRLGPQAQMETSGSALMRNTRFLWEMSSAIVDEANAYALYKVDVTVSWNEGKRNVKLQRSAYASYEEKK